MEFITQNIGTVAVLLVLAVIVGLIINKIRKDKKLGKGSCGCGCSSCAMKDSCPSQNKK
jgi:hypothetical protein